MTVATIGTTIATMDVATVITTEALLATTDRTIGDMNVATTATAHAHDLRRQVSLCEVARILVRGCNREASHEDVTMSEPRLLALSRLL